MELSSNLCCGCGLGDHRGYGLGGHRGCGLVEDRYGGVSLPPRGDGGALPPHGDGDALPPPCCGFVPFRGAPVIKSIL